MVCEWLRATVLTGIGALGMTVAVHQWPRVFGLRSGGVTSLPARRRAGGTGGQDTHP
jgi:hypothetical protein